MINIVYTILDIIHEIYDAGILPDDLYQYAVYSVIIIVPTMCLAFMLACAYNFLTSLVWGVRK